MNIHQKTSNRHRMQLTSTAYCRNKTVWHYFAVAIVLIFSMSAMATSRPKSKHKYRIRRIPEVILDSTIYEANIELFRHLKRTILSRLHGWFSPLNQCMRVTLRLI